MRTIDLVNVKGEKLHKGRKAKTHTTNLLGRLDYMRPKAPGPRCSVTLAPQYKSMGDIGNIPAKELMAGMNASSNLSIDSPHLNLTSTTRYS